MTSVWLQLVAEKAVRVSPDEAAGMARELIVRRGEGRGRGEDTPVKETSG